MTVPGYNLPFLPWRLSTGTGLQLLSSFVSGLLGSTKEQCTSLQGTMQTQRSPGQKDTGMSMGVAVMSHWPAHNTRHHA